MIPCRTGWALSRLGRNGHGLLLNSNLARMGGIESSLCSGCGHCTQDSFRLLLLCPAVDSLHLLALWRLLFSVRSLVEVLGSCPASRAPWFPIMLLSHGRVG